MKRIFLSFAIATLGLWTANAQFGIKGGVNIASMAQEGEDVSQDDLENKSIAGAVVGITYGVNLGDIITIQPELLFSQSGGSNTYNVLGTVTKETFKINYLEFPVLAKLQFGNADQQGAGFHIAAGPWIGYALNGHYKSKTTAGEDVLLEIDRDYSFDDQDDTKRLNYGMIGGAGVSFGRAVLDVRYNYGFNNLLDDDADNNNDNKPVLQTRGVAVTLGYTF